MTAVLVERGNAVVIERLREFKLSAAALEAALLPLIAPTPEKPPTPVSEGLTERQRFTRCLAETLEHEGGYVDHPRDPGGATNLGVTIGTAKAAGLDVDRDGDVDKADVRAFTPKDVEPVYFDRYWRASGCQHLPPGVDLMVFDMAVNSGPARAVRTLQRCLGLTADGAFGPLTITALKVAEPKVLIARYSAAREGFFRSLGTFDTFGKGWMRRLRAVTAKAESWA